MNAKHFLLSRTVWFGILQIAFGAAGLAFGFFPQEQGVALIFAGLATIGLRFDTSQPITTSSQ